jgi:arsenate reductase-like glutaredoxin family protein
VRELAPDTEERNYAKEPLKAAEVKAILAVAPVAEVLNTRHKTAKENGWKEKAPSKAAFTKAVVEENNLLRRPILISGKAYVVGKDEAAIRDLLG